MYKTLTFVALFLLVGSALADKAECLKGGPMCSDCDHEAVCVDLGFGLMFNRVENTCAEGSKCVNGSCQVGAKCNYKPFTCSDVGSFPDPYDCRVYHVCSVKGPGQYVGLRLRCFSGSYDSSSATCGFPLTTDACLNEPVPRCLAPLQLGALQSDPSVYYLCVDDGKTLAPEMYKCTGGRVFDESKMACTATKKSKKVK
ncbi:uncharacterized protein LOC106662122 [Cimex lectularius]|uniref:Chitin-binding type-2 domain-containing protein n=1 Tax=Cimex lectularius TaxID=79782 RepID=A0A8I6R8V2_CIMLE|nr:uncharacterized protein LOC106662122 [Cimex lectularius]